MKLVHQLPLALGAALLVGSAAGWFGIFETNDAANTYKRLIEVDGAQERGFAAVANEVRSLAQRTAKAAGEIRMLISDSVERVDRGAALVNEAGSTMMQIVGATERVTVIVGEISSASAEQSAGVAQVGVAVGQKDQLTQRNATLVEESAAAAESLQHQATQLVESVAQFRL